MGVAQIEARNWTADGPRFHRACAILGIPIFDLHSGCGSNFSWGKPRVFSLVPWPGANCSIASPN